MQFYLLTMAELIKISFYRSTMYLTTAMQMLEEQPLGRLLFFLNMYFIYQAYLAIKLFICHPCVGRKIFCPQES